MIPDRGAWMRARTRSPKRTEEMLSDDEKVPEGSGGPEGSGALARRFADDEVRRILHNAAELQESSPSAHADSGRGLTLSELRQIAEEAGIDPRFVDIAANSEALPAKESEIRWAGAPMNWHLTQSVDVTLREADFERVLLAIRSVMKEQGELNEVFGRMEWSYNDGMGPVIVGVSSREGTTEIDVTSSRSSEAGLFYGLMVPFGGIFGGAVLSSLLGIGGAAALPLIAASGAVCFVGTRLFWKARSKWWSRRLRSLVERVASMVQEAAAVSAGRTSERALPGGEPGSVTDAT